MRVLLIGNPVSGRGQTCRVANRLADFVRSRGHKIDIKYTTSVGSASKIASEIDGAYDSILIAGGDGTINEVINGANLETFPPFLTIPTGTANILARELSLPRTIPKLVDVMERRNVRNLDLGLVNEKRFLMLVSSGFDALVTKMIMLNRPKHLGFRGYIKPIIEALRKYEPSDLHVTTDSTETTTAKLVIIQKIQKYGGIFKFSDKASLTSGVFEVCLFPKGSVTDILRYGLSGILRLSGFMTDIKRVTAHNIRVESTQPSPVEVDGDYFGDTPIDVKLATSTIKVICPVEN